MSEAEFNEAMGKIEGAIRTAVGDCEVVVSEVEVSYAVGSKESVVSDQRSVRQCDSVQ